MLRIDDLKAFVEVCDAGSLVAAANKLAVSQPTLSKAMARLERGLGSQLLERRARGVALTEVGVLLLQHIRGINLSLQDAISAVRDMRHGVSGTVRIGIGIGIPRSLVVGSCRSFLLKSKSSLEILGGMSDSLLRDVANGTIDFAVTGIRPSPRDAIAWSPLFEDSMIPVAPTTNPLTQVERTTWAQLAAETWLMPSAGTATRVWLEKQFVRRGLIPPQRIIGLRNFPRAFELGEMLNAISLAPSSMLKATLDYKSYRALRTPVDWKSDRVVSILYRRRGYLSPAAEQLMKAFKAETKKLGL